MLNDRLMQAITYATVKHDGQKRKVDRTPYIAHPYRVAMSLKAAGYENDVVIAGLLHDVVEDTDSTLIEIKDLFGEQIEKLVAYATEPEKTIPWEQRKQHTIDGIKHAPLAAKLVVCADKIDNLHSILESERLLGTVMWDSFQRGREDQKWYYQAVYESLINGIVEKDTPTLFKQFKRLLDQF
ncbi:MULTISPECIES: HD domain-containing protein [Paraliobacillus]|uniref:HD domain-containing protein n=1 Tax=Paraliobacillus TaxID=200903 RepID=UPI000DD2C5C4|nr:MULTISPECIES: HD domain-containing protein [Paraliobacillus]